MALLLTVGALLSAGAALAQGVETPIYGDILRLGNRGDPPAGFDTMRTSSIALHHAAGPIFGPGNLVMRCRENMYLACPYLAQSWWPSGDFTEWTFAIRRGITWHDGEPFTAEDAKFWLDLAYFGYAVGDQTRAPAYFAGNLGDIVSVEVQGNLLIVKLAEPTVRFPETLLDPRMKIAHPEHLMRPLLDAGQLSVSPLDIGLVGVGPFKLESWEPGNLLQVRRYDAYFERDERGRQLPYLDGIDFYMTPDALAMNLAVRTGRLDGGARGEGHYLTTEQEQLFRETMGDAINLTEIGGGFFRLAFNVLREGPWQDVRVRRAIMLWIDNDAAIAGALGGQAYVGVDEWPGRQSGAFPFGLWPLFDPERLSANRAEAARLMAEAGYADGFTMNYLCRGIHLLRCEFLQDQLGGLGITLELAIVDEAEWNRLRVTAEFDTQSGANFSGTVPEATEAVYGRFSANPDSYARHEDFAVDLFYSRMRTAVQPAQRQAVWRQFERYMLDEMVYVIPIAATFQVTPYHSYVKGLVIPVEDGHAHTDFATVWLDRAQ